MECEVYTTKNIKTLQKESSFTQNVNHSSFIDGSECNLNFEVNEYEELLNNYVSSQYNNSANNTVETQDAAQMESVQEEIVCDIVLESLRNQLCRVCGRKRTSLLPIFGNHLVNEVPVSEKIQMHLPLEVKANDSLPQKICTSCNTMIQAWHDLHVSSVAADLVLRRTFVETFNSMSTTCHPESVSKSLNEDSVLDQPHEKCSIQTTSEIGNEEDTPPTKLRENEKARLNVYSHTPKVKCCYCFENVENLHFKEHKLQCQSKQTMCEFCGVCVQQRYLKNHVRIVHKETMLCETCGKFFSSCNLRTHSSECVLDPIKYCELCSRVFFSEQGHKIHMKEHERGKSQHMKMKIKASFQDELSLTYYCPVCGDCFQDKLSVIMHLNSSKIVTCKPCNKEFRNERAFLAHIHLPNQSNWHCRHCFQAFKRKYSRQIHERTHCVHSKSYSCKMCGRQYPSLESLLQHSLCHGSSAFHCVHCDKKFKRQSDLKEHVLHHEGFIYKCKKCNKLFQTTLSLQIHQAKIHRKSSNSKFRINS